MTPAPKTAPSPTTGKTVTVGCKLPNGLICELGKVGDDNYRQVTLNGANHANIVGGFGLTQVSADFWEAWVAQHKQLAFVQKGTVFAMTDMASARDFATEHAEGKTGFEALDPMAGVKDKNGNPLITPDVNHLMQGKRDTAQAAQRANAG